MFFTNNILAQDIPSLIKKSGVVYPRVSLAISNHESNFQKSKLAKTKNNIFGFKSGNRYKSYTSLEESILDYKRFEARVIKKYNIRDREHYLKTISKFYATSPTWYRKVKSHIKS